MSQLPHTDRVNELLREGKRAEAAKLHNEHLDAQLEKSKDGTPINLSDLMAAKEELVEDEAALLAKARAARTRKGES